MPKNIRGKAFAFNQAIQFVIVPVVALISYLLVPISPFGIDGWRWVVALGSLGAVAVLILRRNIPESPRWLIGHGRLDEADRITAAIEARVRADLGGADLPPPEPHDVELIVNKGSFGEVWAPPYLNRTLMLVVFQFFQTFGYYGFQSWVPTLIAQKGIDISHSLLYSFIIAIANPFGPLIASTFADKIERKWQLTAAILCVGLFVVLFGQQSSVPLLIFFGIMTALSNNVMSYSFHAYQSELFPTRIRARAVGFTYSFSRLSTVFASFIIGASLKEGGVSGVYLLICGAMIISAVAIAGFGPRTRDMQLEQISH
jgi:putative MFS transporter